MKRRFAVAALAAGCALLCIGTENTDAQMDEIEAAVIAAIETGSLNVERVRDAARRVRELAQGTEILPAHPHAAAEGDDTSELERIVAAFDVSPAASAWLAENRGAFQVVLLESEANIAVGEAPWGPAAGDRIREGAGRWGQQLMHRAAAGESLARLDPELPVLLLGRDCHRHAFARAQIDAARASSLPTLVVDMGWPSPARDYADIATFGGSRLVSRALALLLRRSQVPA